MTVRTPDHAAIFAAATFVAMPPLPRFEPVPPASCSSSWSISTISSINEASASRRGSAVNTPAASVSITSVSAPDELGDQGGHPVVVAEADLVVGHGVVLVDDREDVELQQPCEGRSGVQVLLADHEVERGQEHLARHRRGIGVGDLGEHLVVDLHQPGLPHRRDSLQGPGVAGSLAGRHAQSGKPRRDRRRGDEHDAVAGGAGFDDLAADLHDGAAIERAVVVGDRRGPHLDDRDHRSSSSPTITSSDS